MPFPIYNQPTSLFQTFLNGSAEYTAMENMRMVSFSAMTPGPPGLEDTKTAHLCY